MTSHGEIRTNYVREEMSPTSNCHTTGMVVSCPNPFCCGIEESLALGTAVIISALQPEAAQITERSIPLGITIGQPTM